MYWIAVESATSPSFYSNRFIVASDMNLNATCNNAYSLTVGNNVNTLGMTTFTAPATTFTMGFYNPFPNPLTPSVTTLCSSTGIENINAHFEKFVIKNGVDKVIIESPYNEFTMSLFDLSGKQISVNAINSSSVEYDLSDLSSGIYIVKLSAEGYEQRQKIIKQ
jgi:hypothetical protein